MYSFTGSSRNRPMINLGGSSTSEPPKNPTEIMRRAKEERQNREILKRKQAAIISIQAFWRSRKVASQTKVQLRKEFDQLVSFVFNLSSSTSFQLSPADHLRLSRLILVFFTPGNAEDHRRLAQWSNQLVLDQSHPYRSYSLRNDSIGNSWREPIITLMIKKIFYVLAHYPRSEHSMVYFKAAQQMIEDIMSRGDVNALRRLGQEWYWNYLRIHLMSFTINEKNASKTVSMVIELSVRLFKDLDSFNLSPEETRNMLISFSTQIFSIPLLPNRIEISTLVQFSISLPFEELSTVTSEVLKHLELPQVIHLLGNLLCWGSKKLTSSSSMSSKGYESYLVSLQICIDQLPLTLFEMVDDYLEKKTQTVNSKNSSHITPRSQLPTPLKSSSSDLRQDSSSATPMEIDSSFQKINSQRVSPITSMLNQISPKTLQWLSILTSNDHLSSLYAVSNKYARSSRPQFCRLVVSIIFSWVSSRERVLNTLIYTQIRKDGKGNGSGSTTNSGGLMRELWRSSVRSGKLGIHLRNRKAGGSPQGVLTALFDPKMAGDLEALIVLSELYSRCLMTLGDEEFFNDETKLSSNNSFLQSDTSSVLSTGRNPLMLEEVVGLAGLLRNLAFGLYWTEGQADIKQGHVAGTNVSLEQLRTLATRLLQQIYTRDSRRPFCGPEFWSMTSTFDLRSFIQTVVYEESRIEEQEELQQPTSNHHSENDDPDITILEHLPSSSIDNPRSRVSRRQLAFISPRLGVLNNIPFVIPFEQRVAIFRTFIGSDRRRLGLDLHTIAGSRHKASIRRDRVSEDGFLHLSSLGSRLKEPIEIKFIDRYGLEEAGIDGGGVFKEFLTSLTKEIFDPNKGLWLVNKNQELYPNPHSFSREPLSLEWYRFLGQVLGKALYEGILVDVDFADFFLNKWLGKQSYLDDLASLDPELYQGLLFLKHYNGDVESDLSLNFTITTSEFDRSETIELIPNGSKISVTSSNRINYIYLVSKYKLNTQLKLQCENFFKGLNEIVELKWLRMFNQVELKVLVGGLDCLDIDVEDLERWTVYGGWDESHPTIRMFWRVLKSFDNESKRKLLKFVTSCSRPPLLGFKELRPSFGIRTSGNDLTRLPSSSTCVNLLKLPEYDDEEVLREKLMYSISSGAGFDLS